MAHATRTRRLIASWTVLVLAAQVILACLAATAQEKKIQIGILPTYDLSGESYGPLVSRLMTDIVYERYAADPRFSPVFLNPGGQYQPGGDSYLADYLRLVTTPIDIVVATVFTPPGIPDKGDVVLHLKTTAFSQKSGEQLAEWTVDKPLKDRKTFLDFGRAYRTGLFTSNMVLGPAAREFRKQPLGKAAFDLATSSVVAANQHLSAWPATGSPDHFPSNSCTMQFKISYEGQHSVSKNYSIVINDRDEAQGIKEGFLEVKEPAGRQQIRFVVLDSPRRMSRQDVYMLDPILDCSRSSNLLNISLGPAGEAYAAWK